MNLEALRQKIHAIEWQEKQLAQSYSFGVASIDEALPQGGIAAGALHEWVSTNKGAGIGVCASILGRIAKARGPILWCSQGVDLYPPGLQAFGLLPEQVIFVQVQSNQEALWALEEGLKSPMLGAVVGEKIPLRMTNSRRLQLNANQTGVSAFLVQNVKDKIATTSTALTRWQISSLPSAESPGLFRNNGMGAPRFEVELLRCRGGNAPLKWSLEWDESSLCFNLPAAYGERPKKAQGDLPVVQTLHTLDRVG
jgi:protein ImuA